MFDLHKREVDENDPDNDEEVISIAYFLEVKLTLTCQTSFLAGLTSSKHWTQVARINISLLVRQIVLKNVIYL